MNDRVYFPSLSKDPGISNRVLRKSSPNRIDSYTFLGILPSQPCISSRQSLHALLLPYR